MIGGIKKMPAFLALKCGQSEDLNHYRTAKTALDYISFVGFV